MSISNVDIMRKMTVELEPYEAIRAELRPMFDIIHSFEVLETMKIEWEEAIRVDLIECHLREELSIDEVSVIGDMEILSVLKSEGAKHTCLAKYAEPDESKDLFKQFDLDLINTTPFSVSDMKHTYSVIGDDDSLRRYVKLIKKIIGKIESMSFKRAAYQRHDILSVLTDKQRDVMLTAHNYGYYDYPRRMNSERLSEKVEISRSTMVEHLRKAEGRILREILTGYS
jgi:predicted DNA binding protein